MTRVTSTPCVPTHSPSRGARYAALRAAVPEAKVDAEVLYESLLPFLNRKPLMANCAVHDGAASGVTLGRGIEPAWITHNEGVMPRATWCRM